MVNEFLQAVKNEEEKVEEDSSDRFKKLKKKEAGTNRNKAQKRYQELKEEAKQEFIEKQKERIEEKEENDKSEGDKFITY